MAFVDLAVEGWDIGDSGGGAPLPFAGGWLGQALLRIGTAFAGMWGLGIGVSEVTEHAGAYVLIGLLAVLVTLVVVTWALGRIK